MVFPNSLGDETSGVFVVDNWVSVSLHSVKVPSERPSGKTSQGNIFTVLAQSLLSWLDDYSKTLCFKAAVKVKPTTVRLDRSPSVFGPSHAQRMLADVVSLLLNPVVTPEWSLCDIQKVQVLHKLNYKVSLLFMFRNQRMIATECAPHFVLKNWKAAGLLILSWAVHVTLLPPAGRVKGCMSPLNHLAVNPVNTYFRGKLLNC